MLTAKVCGMTTAAQAMDVAGAGADLLGFIFHPASPRHVAAALPAGVDTTARKVGVFVRQGLEEVLALLAAGRLDLAQLHGGQDVDFCRAVGPARVVRAFWPQKYADAGQLQADLELYAPVCSWFLFDAGSSGGGHGAAFDWTVLRGIDSPRPWLLAGGLNPGNLAEALAVCRPLPKFFGVDLNSGVEASPGVKDMDKVRQALALVKT